MIPEESREVIGFVAERKIYVIFLVTKVFFIIFIIKNNLINDMIKKLK